MEPGAGDLAAAERARARAFRVEQLTHIGSWEWDLRSSGLWWSDELYRIYGLEPGEGTITLQDFLSRVHPDDRPHTLAEVSQAIARAGRFAYAERILRPDGSQRTLDTVGEVVLDEADHPALVLGTCRDVTEATREASLSRAQQAVLEAIVAQEPLDGILRRIAEMIDRHAPSTLASILLVDHDTGTVRHGAAPHLPAEFFRSIDGASIGPRAGSCGTAAYLGKPVYVGDIALDPLWDDWRALAIAHGLRACWSTPFFGKDGRVLGTFAIYAKEPRLPNEEDLRLIQLATHLTGVAVENRRLQEQLRALAEHVERIREEERTAIAREIHDVVGQSLTALKLDLARLGRGAKGGPLSASDLHQRLEGPLGSVDELLGQVQRISAELRPGMLDDLGLSAAVEWQARELTRRTGIPCEVVDRLGEATLEPRIATAAFRIFQEALTNVCRHAKASRVDVALERREDQLRLAVRDDGRGIPPEALSHPRSLGLLGMRERASRLGGTVSVGPVPSGGTQLELRLPTGARELRA